MVSHVIKNLFPTDDEGIRTSSRASLVVITLHIAAVLRANPEGDGDITV